MKRKTEAFVDPWGVTDAEYTTLEANLFAASLFPYLFFLFFLGKPETAFPKRALFGFKFLLVFVFATIPAGIYAKVHYSDILANVDWLHGGAESLLTITNLLIVLGMREGLRDAEREAKEKREKDLTTTATTTLRSVDSVVVNSENSSGKSMGDARSENDDGGSTENRININSTFVSRVNVARRHVPLRSSLRPLQMPSRRRRIPSRMLQMACRLLPHRVRQTRRTRERVVVTNLGHPRFLVD